MCIIDLCWLDTDTGRKSRWEISRPTLHLEKKLESGLYCEPTDKELKDSYGIYLLYDTIASRISIDEVEAKEVNLPSENVCGNMTSPSCWLLVVQAVKLTFILTLIEALLHTDSKLYIPDPKNADLGGLSSVMANVRKEDLLSCIETFYEEMMKRSEEMKQTEAAHENEPRLAVPSCHGGDRPG